MWFISCHITPLAINSLGGGHTHTHTHTHTHIHTHTDTYTYRHPHRNNLRNQVHTGLGQRAPGLKMQPLVTL